MSATAAAFAESGHGGCPLQLPPIFRDVTAEKVGTVGGDRRADGCEGNEARVTDAAIRSPQDRARAGQPGSPAGCQRDGSGRYPWTIGDARWMVPRETPARPGR